MENHKQQQWIDETCFFEDSTVPTRQTYANVTMVGEQKQNKKEENHENKNKKGKTYHITNTMTVNIGAPVSSSNIS